MKKYVIAVLTALLATCWSGAIAAENSSKKGLAEAVAQNVEFSGLVEVAAFAARVDVAGQSDEDTSDIVVATVELGAEAKLNEQLSANLVFLFEEGENDDEIAVDQAFISYARDAWELTAGRVYLPFGDYTTNMVTDPLTLELGETQDSAAVLGYDMKWLKVEAFIYNGSAQRGNPAVADDTEESHLKDFGVAVTAVPFEGLRVGASLISDLADSNAELALAANGTNVYYHRVPAISSHAVFDLDRFQLLGEFVAALTEFDEKEGGTLANSSPLAWNTEAAFALTPQTKLAAAVGGSDEFPGAPELFVAFTASWNPWEYLTVSAEVAHQDYDNTYGGGLDSVDMVALQVGAEF